jgi:putative membrane protein
MFGTILADMRAISDPTYEEPLMTLKKTYLAAAVSAVLLGMSGAALPQQGTTQGDRSATPAQKTERAAERAADRTERAADRATDRVQDSDRRADRRDKGDKVGSGDRHFIRDAAQHGMAEVAVANMAKEKAANDQVKKYAEKLVQDHSKANEELKQIATSLGVKLPDDVERKHKRAMDNLSKASGAEFDRKFMEAMVKDHERDLKDFRKEAKGAKHPELKAFAEKGATVIDGHLQEARTIASAVGAKGGKGDRSAARRDNDRDAATGSSARRDGDANRDATGSAARSGSAGSTGPTQGRDPATGGNRDSSGNK